MGCGDDDLPFRLQSAQTLLSCCLTNSLRILAFLSVVALSCLDMMVDENGAGVSEGET